MSQSSPVGCGAPKRTKLRSGHGLNASAKTSRLRSTARAGTARRSAGIIRHGNSKTPSGRTSIPSAVSKPAASSAHFFFGSAAAEASITYRSSAIVSVVRNVASVSVWMEAENRARLGLSTVQSSASQPAQAPPRRRAHRKTRAQVRISRSCCAKIARAKMGL